MIDLLASGALLLGNAFLLAASVATRPAPGQWTPRVLGAVAIFVLAGSVWCRVEPLRVPLTLVIVTAIPLAGLLRSRWFRTVRRPWITFPLSTLGAIGWAGFGVLALMGDRLLSDPHPRFDRSQISPDGRWEARLVQDGLFGETATLRLRPRGLVTLDPFAYPDRKLDDVDCEGAELRSIEWRDDRTLVIRSDIGADSKSTRRETSGPNGVRWIVLETPPGARP